MKRAGSTGSNSKCGKSRLVGIDSGLLYRARNPPKADSHSHTPPSAIRRRCEPLRAPASAGVVMQVPFPGRAANPAIFLCVSAECSPLIAESSTARCGCYHPQPLYVHYLVDDNIHKEQVPRSRLTWNLEHYIILLSLELGVMPGSLPLLATGFPSTSWRSAVKSIGLAPLM